MILSFAFAGLFLVGNNVFGVDSKPGDSGPGGISYNQYPGPGAVCWEYDAGNMPPYEWTGYMYNACWQ